mmetsp:Transcript_4297/g.3132  ORF Transcript_4297/g.3132 Transcript_4297/m.3132 type:complete len:82 (+) Transcript_4297:223-468(+)
MIEVQWFYKKSDLDFKKLLIFEDDQKYIGDNEVFPTNHHDKIYVDCIHGRCKVYNIKEYDELETIDNTTFFTRASYNPVTK